MKPLTVLCVSSSLMVLLVMATVWAYRWAEMRKDEWVKLDGSYQIESGASYLLQTPYDNDVTAERVRDLIAANGTGYTDISQYRVIVHVRRSDLNKVTAGVNFSAMTNK